MPLETATVLLAGATALLALIASVQAGMTWKLARASAMQLKTLAPPALHLVLFRRKAGGIDVSLIDEGRLTVAIQNFGQAEADIQWIRVQPGKRWVWAEGSYPILKSGKRHEFVFEELTPEEVASARAKKTVPISARFAAEGTGLLYNWSARFRYDPDKHQWEREGPPSRELWRGARQVVSTA